MRLTVTPLNAAEEAIVSTTIGSGIAVHRELGPGFREHVYQEAYCLELSSQGLHFEREKRVLVKFKEWMIPYQNIDLIVENLLLIEIKAVPRLRELHRAQVRSYLKTTGLRVDLLMNFNSILLKDGMRRIVL